MYYVYVLKSTSNGKLYKGFTTNLKRRLVEHHGNKNTYTCNNGPWELVYYEAFVSKTRAMEEEKFLKSGKGRERLKYLI